MGAIYYNMRGTLHLVYPITRESYETCANAYNQDKIEYNYFDNLYNEFTLTHIPLIIKLITQTIKMYDKLLYDKLFLVNHISTTIINVAFSTEKITVAMVVSCGELILLDLYVDNKTA